MFNMQALKLLARRLSTERSFNRVTLIGRAGAEAQLKGTHEHPVVIFNLATNSGQKTEWHRISVFKPGLRTLAEEYVKSGMRVMVEGKVSYGHIINSDGQATPTTSIIAEDIIFLSSSSQVSKSNSTYNQEDIEQAKQN